MNLAEEEISYMVSRFLLGHTRAPTTSLPTSLSIPGSPPACAPDQNHKELGPPCVLKTAALDPCTALITMGGH